MIKLDSQQLAAELMWAWRHFRRRYGRFPDSVTHWEEILGDAVREVSRQDITHPFRIEILKEQA